jgi:hypothetical protein
MSASFRLNFAARPKLKFLPQLDDPIRQSLDGSRSKLKFRSLKQIGHDDEKKLALFCSQQGDQIGRIFAHWVIVSFGKVFLIAEVPLIFGLLFPLLTSCTNFEKNGLGGILGDFFTKTSGHPVCSSSETRHQT